MSYDPKRRTTTTSYDGAVPPILRVLSRASKCGRAAQVVAVVASGEDLIDQASKLSPDAVLSDVGLDGLDGISATVEIRRRFPTIPIVLLTGSDVDALRLSAIAAGASALLPKSDPNVFVGILHQLLLRAQ